MFRLSRKSLGAALVLSAALGCSSDTHDESKLDGGSSDASASTSNGATAQDGGLNPRDGAPSPVGEDAGHSATAGSSVDAGPLQASDASAADSGGGSAAADGGATPNDGGLPVSPATLVSAGSFHGCLLTTDKNVQCWQLNLMAGGTTKPAMVPTLLGNVATFSAGGWRNGNETGVDCFVTTVGAVWCWGGNSDGELGNGTTTASTVPVPVSTLSSGVASVSVGRSTGGGSPCAVTTEGAVWCWGSNRNLILGSSGPRGSSTIPVQVAGFSGPVASVSVGGNSACALLRDGTVACWGTNANGELGNNSTVNAAAPQTVVGLKSATAVSVGWGYACALVSGGGVQCWGNNGFGASKVPQPVAGLTSGVTSISVASDYACAVLNGGVQCWGHGFAGQLGNNSNVDSAIPVPVSGPSQGVVAVSLGFGVACELTDKGGIWCWYPAIYTYSNVNYSTTPVPVWNVTQ